MSKDMFSRKKFLSGKGFYIALAACVVGAGTIAYISYGSTMNSIGENSQDNDVTMDNSTAEENWSFPDLEEVSENVTNLPKASQETPKSSTDTTNQPKPSTEDLPKDTQPNTTPQPSSELPKSPEKPQNSSSSQALPTTSTEQSSSIEQPQASQTSQKTVYMYPVSGEVFNKYSNGELVKNKTLNDWRTHDGIDIKADIGTPVKACATGSVSKITTEQMWGTTIEISHPNGLTSIYSCLDETVSVKEGASVKVGDVIGTIGNKGLIESSLGPHLHFAMRDEKGFIDPLSTMNKAE